MRFPREALSFLLNPKIGSLSFLFNFCQILKGIPLHFSSNSLRFKGGIPLVLYSELLRFLMGSLRFIINLFGISKEGPLERDSNPFLSNVFRILKVLAASGEAAQPS